MQPASHATVIEAFGATMAADSARPLITFYDDASGERGEVSAATLGNWVAKTANLLADGLGLDAGELAVVDLPPHWQTAAVLLGCWSAGLMVRSGPVGAGARRDGGDDDGPAAAVAFVPAGASVPLAGDVLVLALAPMAAPVRPGPPPGTLDYVLEVRGYGDHFPGRRVGGQALALADGTTHADLVTRARGRGVPPGGRVLIDGDITTDPVSWLVAPLTATASVVLCRNCDPKRRDQRLAIERAVAYP